MGWIFMVKNKWRELGPSHTAHSLLLPCGKTKSLGAELLNADLFTDIPKDVAVWAKNMRRDRQEKGSELIHFALLTHWTAHWLQSAVWRTTARSQLPEEEKFDARPTTASDQLGLSMIKCISKCFAKHHLLDIYGHIWIHLDTSGYIRIFKDNFWQVIYLYTLVELMAASYTFV